MVRQPIPENLRHLWAEEDRLLGWAAEIISDIPHLSDQIEHVVCYMDCVESLRKTRGRGDRFYGFVSLFIRNFDNFGGALRSCMSGRYRASAMYLRDALETDFLLDDLITDADRFAEWFNATPQTIRKKFAADAVRRRLDERDGFSERKRLKRYELLSALGAHPSPQGIQLYKDGMNVVHSGPFKNRNSVQQCVEEAARTSVSGAASLIKFCGELGQKGQEIAVPLSLAQQKIYYKYFTSDIN